MGGWPDVRPLGDARRHTAAPSQPPSARPLSHRIIECRLEPPTLPALNVSRGALRDGILKRLDEPGQIVGLFAPAGHAKTSLLRSVHAELVARSRRVAWLTLAPEISGQLGRYLGSALGRAGVEVGSVDDGEALPALVNALAGRAEPLVLLIDNLDQLKAQDSVALLDRLLASLPASVRVVIAGRRNPGLRLPALLAQRRLSLIEPAELAFSFAETTEFLIRETGEALGAAALNEVHELTRGWPGLLSVLVSSLPGRESLETLLRETGLPQRELSAYIEDEVVAELPAADRPAVEVLALAAQVDQRMLAFVLEAAACPDLEQLSRRNPVVRPLARGGFAIHPSIQTYLRNRLESDDRPRFRKRCRRLAEWYRDQGDAAMALDHLINSGELAQAIALLEVEGRNMALAGFPDRCLAWLARLHPEHPEGKPGLQLAEVWARVTMHQTTAVSELLNSAMLRSAKRRNPAFDIEVMTASAFSHAISDDPGAALAAVDAVPAEAQASSAIVRAGCASVRAWCLFCEGRFDEARSVLYRSGSLEMQGQGLLTHAYASIVSGECYAAEGNVGTAEAIFRRAVDLAEELRGRRSMVVVVALGPLLEILYEADRIDEVLALASGRSHLRLKYSTPGSSSAAGVALASSLMQRNAGAEAAELLDDMLRVGEENHLPRLVAHALAARIELALRDVRRQELPELAGRLEAFRNDAAGLMDSPQGVINFLCRISRVRMLAARDDHPAAIAEARALSEALSPSPWLRARVFADALLAAVLWRANATSEAIERFARLVQRSAPLGMIRSLVDPLGSVSLLEAPELRQAVPPPLHAYLDRLKAAMTTGPSSPHPEQRIIAPGSGWTDATLAGPDPGFTTREREILFLVARGLPVKRIAQTLRIAPETAKWHLRNIYEKLGVHDRAAAQLAIRRLQVADRNAPR